MDGPNSNLMTKDDLQRAFDMVKMGDPVTGDNSQQPYMMVDEATVVEEEGVLFGNGVGDSDLFDFQGDDASDEDGIYDGGIYQETDVGQFVNAEGEMEPLPDPAFYPQTTAATYGLGEASDADALRAKMDALLASGGTTTAKADKAAAIADATEAVKESGATGIDLINMFKSKLAAAEKRRADARAAGNPIPITASSGGGGIFDFIKRNALWFAIGGTVVVGGTIAIVALRRR